jgi:tyrosyl-tRNA synthetase
MFCNKSYGRGHITDNHSHGFLDSLKAPLELVEARAEYYRHTITAMLEAVGVPTEKLEFVLGSSYQKGEKYVMDVYKLAALTSEHDAKKAGAEVVKQSENAPLSGLLYPLLQVLDEEHLDVDIQFGGLDQRKLFTAAIEWLPRLGYKQRAHLLNPLIPGLGESGKMSSSDENSKIDLLDSEEVVSRKIKKALAVPKQPEGNVSDLWRCLALGWKFANWFILGTPCIRGVHTSPCLRYRWQDQRIPCRPITR